MKDDGGDSPTHTTNSVMHENAGTDQSTLITLDEVNKEALEVYQTVVRELLAGKRTAMTFDGMCRADGCETDGTLTASFYHDDYDFCLMTLTVYPPERDGADARSVMDLYGIEKVRGLHGDALTKDLRSMIMLLGDAGRVLTNRLSNLASRCPYGELKFPDLFPASGR